MNTTTRDDAARVLSFLDAYSSYYVVGHKEPDGDCVASQLVMASFLRRRGKKAVLLSAGPFTRTEIASYAPLFTDKLPPSEPAGEAVVVLDCSSMSRVGGIEGVLPPGLPVAVIDHHAVGGSRDGSGVSYFVDPGSPAVAVLVQSLMEAAGSPPTKEEAELLLFGICTDSGFFRHLDERSGPVFAAVGRLVATGASPKRAFDMMNGGKAFESRKLMGELLTRAETRYGGKLVVTSMDLADQERYGLIGRDSDMLYQLLMTVAGVEVALVVRQESAADCTVGLRSRESVDVAAVAARFGGGGHRLAAGLHIAGQAKDIVELIAGAFAQTFA